MYNITPESGASSSPNQRSITADTAVRVMAALTLLAPPAAVGMPGSAESQGQPSPLLAYETIEQRRLRLRRGTLPHAGPDFTGEVVEPFARNTPQDVAAKAHWANAARNVTQRAKAITHVPQSSVTDRPERLRRENRRSI